MARDGLLVKILTFLLMKEIGNLMMHKKRKRKLYPWRCSLGKVRPFSGWGYILHLITESNHLVTMSRTVYLFIYVVCTALQKAGKHMEDSVVAAYVALLLGCIVQENEVSVMRYIEIGVYTIDRDV